MALSGKVALVTGASRGLGKGIALQLGEAGATVYITGRTVTPSSGAAGPGSLQHTAEEVTARGGKAIPVACDHSKDEDIEGVFQQIIKEQGRLDILVNNAYSAVNALQDNFGRPFWEIPESIWDDVNNVGLRNHYICSVKAAKIMVKQKSGLIVNVSSGGGKQYIFTPSYGIGKAAFDRMAADCALELKPHNVTYVSLWPGPVKTELIQEGLEAKKAGKAPASTETLKLGANSFVHQAMANGESAEFSGKCLVSLFQDPKMIEKTGKIVTTASLGEEYNLVDIDGRKIKDLRG
ncbi:dehydrogenase/reductase SDR family member 1-like [Paramacrobiotus metropolitanus]|uniref:dehydrogenase/reductase SDR family member 1-like n=1 Tax=Paramacrobiotus metropolitanus TaxID=2943436 RepID=UPI002445D81A|nr:dehydrogenase/reductase SDR family member 1-like [Paramacrobiotus metropolitanus]